MAYKARPVHHKAVAREFGKDHEKAKTHLLLPFTNEDAMAIIDAIAGDADAVNHLESKREACESKGGVYPEALDNTLAVIQQLVATGKGKGIATMISKVMKAVQSKLVIDSLGITPSTPAGSDDDDDGIL